MALPASAGTYVPCNDVAGNLVANCGFETGDLTDWIGGGNFEFTGTTTGAITVFAGANSGRFYAYLGPADSDATLSQTLSTVAGQRYILSFYLAAAGDDVSNFSARWNGSTLYSVTDLNTGTSYAQHQFAVVGTGSDTLQFAFRDDPAYMLLDDVVVTASSVPEPGTLFMLLGGFGVAVLARRGRRP